MSKKKGSTHKKVSGGPSRGQNIHIPLPNRGRANARQINALPAQPMVIQPQQQPAPDYRNFLNLLVGLPNSGNLPGSLPLTQQEVNLWPNANLNTQKGNMVNEMSQRVNNRVTHTLGVQEFDQVRPGTNMYGKNVPTNRTFLNLGINQNNLPDPMIVGHEQMHMDHHQGPNNLNANGWDHLKTFHDTQGVGSANFEANIRDFQRKINPIFATHYGPNKQKIINEVNRWRAQPNRNEPPLPNKTTWNNLFDRNNANNQNHIDRIVKEPDPNRQGRFNPNFELSLGSEFYTFPFERLDEHWDRGRNLNATNRPTNPQRFNTPERTMMSSIFNDIGNAYQQQPTINTNAQARENSVNRKSGGHVKNYAGGGYIMNNASYNPSLSSSLMQYIRPQQMDDPNIGDEEMDDSNIDMQNAYAKGGRVNQHPSSITEFIRQQGRDGDTILAHINPIEAHILKSIGGSGTINPKTGLPEFRGGFFSPRYWEKGAWKRDAAAIVGNVIGNTIAPGLGGVIGAALGSAAGTKIRGRNDYAGHMAKSAALAAIAPTVAGLAGTGANAMGATNVGHALTKYGNINAILPSIGFGGESSGVGSYMSPAMNAMGGSNQSPMQYLPQQEQQYQYSQNPYVDNRSFGDKFSGNMKDYFTQPGNLLTLGTAAAQYMGRPKPVRPKTPEQLADEERRYRNASRMTAAEVEAEEELNTVRKNATKRHKDAIINQELANIGQLHRKVNSPEEYAQRGQWLEYYDNPQFTGERIRMKAGGQVHSPHSYLIEQETIYPGSLMGYIRGINGGQDDDVNAMLSNGEYVIDASTVADLGDGNNEAGARKLDAFRERVRKHKRGGSINLPPKSKSLLNYMRG